MPTSYDDIAPCYESVIGPFERWFLPGLREKALGLLPRDARTLEVGAGTGLNFIYYRSAATGVASEPSREMLRIAQTKTKPAGVNLIQNCGEQLPFKSDSFDAAFATLVFCSIEQPSKAFAELRRVVRAGGTIVLLEHVRPSNLLGPLFDLFNLVTVPLFGDHMNRRTAREAERAGLQVIAIERHRLGIINLISCRV